MKCKYCQTETRGDFCSKEHKDLFNNKISEAIHKNCPIIQTKGLTKKEVELQRQWKLKNKKKAKVQCLIA